MPKESVAATSAEINARKIALLIEKHKELLGPTEIISLGEAGLILKRETNQSAPAKDWLLLDYDDTLAASTEIKKERLRLYVEYLQNKLNLTETTTQFLAENIIKLADEFARWENPSSNIKQYHLGAHMMALSWASEYLINHAQQPSEEVLAYLRTQLDSLKETIASTPDKQTAAEKLAPPFYFKADKLISKNKRPWLAEIENIFQQTSFNPPLYQEPLASIKSAETPSDNQLQNLVIFTYGEPYFQLSKVIKLLEQNPDLQVAQIWLTQTSKGKFVQAIWQKGQVSEAQLDQVKTLTLVDDDPKQLKDFADCNAYMETQAQHPQLIAIRSKRPGTKTAQKDWPTHPYGELNFAEENQPALPILTILQINRYRALRDKLAADDPQLKNLAMQLEQARVELDKIV